MQKTNTMLNNLMFLTRKSFSFDKSLFAIAKVKHDTMFVCLRYMGCISEKDMEADYQNVEDSSGQLLARKAMNAVDSGNSGTEQMFEQLVDVFSSAFGRLTYSALVLGVIPWGIPVLLAAGIADFYVGLRFTKMAAPKQG